jgi:hypothetical protein
MDKIDCFAWQENDCYALKVRACEGCGFYKPKNDDTNIEKIEAAVREWGLGEWRLRKARG